MPLAGWLNSAWMWKCRGELRAFRRGMRSVETTQAAVLQDIVRANRDTEFGRTHGFRAIATPRDFQARVPLSRFDDYAGEIGRIAAGEANVLTSETVRLFEPTSGASSGEKWIPYTDGLRRQFQRGIAAWIGDLFHRRPAVRRGRAYWSISPAFGQARRTASGIPIGFDDDTAYLGRAEQWALRRLLVAPASLAKVDDLETFRYGTLLCLLAAEDLALISVWSPTFLAALLNSLAGWWEPLCHDLRRGTAGGPSRNAAWCHWAPSFAANPRRADEVAAIARSIVAPADDFPEALRRIWPRLALISCWTDAAASRAAAEVRHLFPHVEIQRKGLLATEGIVSIPLMDCPAPALALRSHFFEFADAPTAFDENGSPMHDPRRLRLAHELESGGRYRIVLTTAGGLYRYCLGDEVEVVGFGDECPLLRFLGRGNRVSDLVGEKLSEAHVRRAIDRSLAEIGWNPRFALLTPIASRPARYRLYLQLAAGVAVGEGAIAGLQRSLEIGLAANPHYRYAVGIGQLGPAEIQLLDSHGEPAWQVYERRCLALGVKVGNIKPVALDCWDGWAAAFAPLLPAAPSPRPACRSFEI